MTGLTWDQIVDAASVLGVLAILAAARLSLRCWSEWRHANRVADSVIRRRPEDTPTRELIMVDPYRWTGAHAPNDTATIPTVYAQRGTR